MYKTAVPIDLLPLRMLLLISCCGLRLLEWMTVADVSISCLTQYGENSREGKSSLRLGKKEVNKTLEELTLPYEVRTSSTSEKSELKVTFGYWRVPIMTNRQQISVPKTSLIIFP
ncbi:hypothetical protein Ancab_029439 [Ancistrocladus abbreviatus]